MSKRLKLSSILAMILAFALVLSACVPGADKNDAGTAAKQELTLIETSEPPNLDSAKTSDTVSFTILNNVMEGLYRVGKNDQLEPGMAAGEPQVSADKKTYIIKLKDAKWSDGKPVTAHDFEYAWKRALDPKTASEYAYILYPILNAEKYNTGKAKAEDVGVKALDDKTLEVKLEAPIPYFKDLLAFPTYFPQRKDIVEKYGDKYALEASNMVYNGPFVLADWKHEQSFTYKKNENYWDKDTVKLNKVTVNIVKDDVTGVNLFETGRVDYARLPGELVDKYKNNPNVLTVQESGVYYLEMNQTKPFFKNKKVRQALMLAIDRKALTDNLLKNGSIPANGIVPPVIKANDQKKFREVSNLPPLEFNPQKAKQLLQEGLKELGMSAPPKVEILTSDTSASKLVAEFLKEQLRVNLGVETVITSVPLKQRLARAGNGQFDLHYANWYADYNDPMTFIDVFITGFAKNRGKWSNPEYDKLVAKSKTNPNFEERLQDLIKAEKILIDDAGVVPLFYRSRMNLVKPYVKDMVWHVIGPEYSLKWAHVEGK